MDPLQRNEGTRSSPPDSSDSCDFDWSVLSPKKHKPRRRNARLHSKRIPVLPSTSKSGGTFKVEAEPAVISIDSDSSDEWCARSDVRDKEASSVLGGARDRTVVPLQIS